MAEVFPFDEELLNIRFEDEEDDEDYGTDAELCLIEFQNVNEAIAFARDFWPNQDAGVISTMLAIQAEDLEEGDGWLCMESVCDICGEAEIDFLPAIIFEDGIVGQECFNCGNWSMYPAELNVCDED